MLTVLPVTAAPGTLALDRAAGKWNAGAWLELLEDSSATLTLSDVMTSDGWRPSTSDDPNLGFTQSAWWARLTVDPGRYPDSGWYLLIDDPILNNVDVYILQDGEPPLYRRGGGLVPMSEREMQHRSHAFPLPAGDKPLTIYVRAASKLAVVLPLRILDITRLNQETLGENWRYCLYFGFMVAMFLFNAVVALRMRQMTNLLYCAFSICIISVSLSFSGIGKQALWPALDIDNYLLPISCALASLMGYYFTQVFLFDRLATGAPWQKQRVTFSTAVSLGVILLAALDRPDLAIQLSALVTVFIVANIFFNSFHAYRSGRANAPIMIAAWSAILFGALMFAARGFGLVPSNFFTTNVMQIATVADSFLLMFAMIEKSRQLREENARFNAQRISFLEREVKARTSELEAAQHELVLAEQASALGVFSAGMAHEINNPANFVSVGAQNAAAQIEGVRSFIEDLMDGDADPGMTQRIRRETDGLMARQRMIIRHMEDVTKVIEEVRAVNPEGDAGETKVDVPRLVKNACKIASDKLGSEATFDVHSDSQPTLTCNVSEVHRAIILVAEQVLGSRQHLAGQIRVDVRMEGDTCIIDFDHPADPNQEDTFDTMIVDRVMDKHGGTFVRSPRPALHLPVVTTLLALMASGVLAIFSSLFASPASALEVNSFVDTLEPIRLGLLLEMAEADASASLGQMMDRQDWKKSDSHEPNFGFTTSAWWARMAVRLPDDQQRWYLHVDDAILNEIDIHFIAADGSLSHLHGGGTLPISERSIPYRTHLFRIPAGMREFTFYMRAKSELAVVFPVQLISEKALILKTAQDSSVYALYFGFVLSMLLFNLIVWLRLRDTTNLLYCLFCVAVIAMSLSFSGYGKLFLWPEAGNVDNYIFGFSGSFASLSANAFTRRFLFENAHENVFFLRQRAHILLSVAGFAWLSLSIGNIFLGTQISGFVVLLCFVNIMVNTAISLSRKTPNSLLILVAWAGLIAGSIIFVLRGFNMVESNLWTANAVILGSMFECFLLVIALIEKSRALSEDLERQEKNMLDTLEVKVSERKAEILQTQQKLVDSQKSRALGQFMASMGKRIETPLAATETLLRESTHDFGDFKSFILSLSDDSELTEGFNKRFSGIDNSLRIIRDGTQRIRRILSQLSSDDNDGPTGINLREHLQTAWQSVAERRDILPAFSCDGEIPLVQGHAGALFRLFHALLSNAADACEDAGMNDPRVHVELGEHEGRVTIGISDNGTGIACDKIDKIFDPFFTTKVVGRGAGLGLTMARDVVSKHGGTLTVTSAPGEGSTFLVSFPSLTEAGPYLAQG